MTQHSVLHSAPSQRWLSVSADAACIEIHVEPVAVPLPVTHVANLAPTATSKILFQRLGHLPTLRHINGDQRAQPQTP
jgi:hypothetical protein